ncbi:prepilin peptidase [Anaerobacillus sp. CMMVII]|uniref:A24 family peptidase n=1 Tax=Anaerobacillus sp. CMMVII TaxID=2755588 RepID=UPI0021B77D49|nr:prepilin peptidase [Anaerobacillus sp. CMMVII]
MAWINLLLLILLLVCLITDLKNRRIYNKVLFPTLALAIIIHTFIDGWAGLSTAFLGFLIGLGILIIPFLLGGMGAGDVKLLAVIGALKGTSFVIVTAIYMALAGGIIAIVIILMKKGSAKALLYHFFGKKYGVDLPYEKSALSTTFPYGIAIVAGAIFTLFSQEKITLW